MRFLESLALLLIAASTASVEATTLGPNWVRQEGQPSRRCTNDFRYPLANGTACCQFKYKRDYTYINSECDGGLVEWTTPRECCVNKVDIDCGGPGAYPCQQKPKIPTPQLTTIHAESPEVSGFSAPLVFDDGCDDDSTPNFWMTPDGAVDTGALFLMDLGDKFSIRGARIRNAHNAANDDAGVQDFTILTSDDGINPIVTYQSTLTDATVLPDCASIPLETHNFEAFTRYIGLRADTFYGARAALQYFELIL